MDPSEGLCDPLPSSCISPSCMPAIQKANTEAKIGPVSVSKKCTFFRCKVVLLFGLCSLLPPPHQFCVLRVASVLKFLCNGEFSYPAAFLDKNFVFDLQQKLDKLINILSKFLLFSFPPQVSLKLFWEQKLLQLLHLFTLLKLFHLCIIGCRAGNKRLFLPISI